MATRAEELLEAGRLGDAVKAQTEEVRARPADRQARFVLFELLCLAGDLERAPRQLDALAVGASPAAELRTRLCRSLVAAEGERRAVWSGSARPLLAPDAPATLEGRIAALGRLREGDREGAARRLAEASAAAVSVAGRINEQPFEQIRDTDELGASVLEVFAQGRCLWLSFEQLRRLEIDAPRSLLDLVWAPARLWDARGNESLVHLPTLYAGTHEEQDDRLRLGRVTEWAERAGVMRGIGQKVLLTAAGDREDEWSLLDVRSLEVAT